MKTAKADQAQHQPVYVCQVMKGVMDPELVLVVEKEEVVEAAEYVELEPSLAEKGEEPEIEESVFPEKSIVSVEEEVVEKKKQQLIRNQ